MEESDIFKNKKLAIIGGGLCGILAAKFAKEAGFDLTVFEKSNESGGVWCGNNRAWPHMHTNICKYGSGFSDFSWKDNDPMYPSRKEMLDFIYDYIKTFNIAENFSFNTEIIKVTLAEDSLKYKIKGIKQNKEFIIEFDYVIVATGYFNTPNYSSFEKYLIYDKEKKSLVSNPELTSIKIVHSSSYKSPDEFKDKNVMVIGHSHSATQISAEISEKANKLYNCFRRPYFVFPLYVLSEKYQKKIPLDLELFHQKDDILKLENIIIDLSLKLTSCEKKLKLTNQNKIHKDLYIDPNLEEKDLPDISISEHYCKYVEEGRVIPIKSEIKEIKQNSVIINNDQEYEVDYIVVCTGYKIDLSIIDNKILDLLKFDVTQKYNPLALDYSVYNPNLPTMGFVGMCRGLLYVTYELQAKLAVTNFIENIKNNNNKVNFHCSNFVPKGVTNENYNLYTFGLADRLNLTPDLKRIKEIDKKLYEAILEGPLLTQEFNLNKNLNENSENWVKHSAVIKNLFESLKHSEDIK